MKKPVWIALVVALAASKAGAASVGALAFMSGCWTTAPGAAEVMRECFTAPHAGLMQSSSQTVKGGETTFWEFAVIEQTGDAVTYTPFLKGKRSVGFTATTLTAGHVVFENPEHDFPKKIMYRLIAPGRLEARIEGNRTDDPANQSWSLIPQ
jgi:hypothetical protein